MMLMSIERHESGRSRRVPEELSASPEEIATAIEELTDGELLKLEKYARYRIRGLGRKALGRDHDDLLREAMAATLAGNRRWKKHTVDFFTHIAGVMRSLSSHWAEQFDPSEARLESEFTTAGENLIGEMSPLMRVASDSPDPERLLDVKQQLAKIERFFEKDPIVPQIIEGFRAGLTGNEIQSQSGMSKNDYESAIRRMRRGVTALERKGTES